MVIYHIAAAKHWLILVLFVAGCIYLLSRFGTNIEANDWLSKNRKQKFSLGKFCSFLFFFSTAWKVFIFGVFLVRIQSKCGKKETRKIPNMDTFHAVFFYSSSSLQSLRDLEFLPNLSFERSDVIPMFNSFMTEGPIFNNKVDSVNTGRVVIVDLLPWSDLEKCMYTTLFGLMIMKSYHHYLIYKYNYTCSVFWTTCKLTSDIKVI